MILFIFILSQIVGAEGDYPKNYIPITDPSRLVCEKEKSECFVTQMKNNEKYQIIFDLKKPNSKDTFIEKIYVRQVSNGKQEHFSLPTPKLVPINENVPFFWVDVNQDGYSDLALQSGVSNRKGYVYYYGIYNPKDKKFVFSKEMFPAFHPLSSDKKMISLTSEDIFLVDKNYHIQDAKK